MSFTYSATLEVPPLPFKKEYVFTFPVSVLIILFATKGAFILVSIR